MNSTAAPSCTNPARIIDTDARFGAFELAASWTPGLSGNCNDHRSHPDGVFGGFNSGCSTPCTRAS